VPWSYVSWASVRETVRSGPAFVNEGWLIFTGWIPVASSIAECYANFECRLVDGSRINRYGLFIFEVVKAHVAASPRYPETVHYRGDGVFMISGRNRSYRRHFKAVNL
jgi:hypothetical protein